MTQLVIDVQTDDASEFAIALKAFRACESQATRGALLAALARTVSAGRASASISTLDSPLDACEDAEHEIDHG